MQLPTFGTDAENVVIFECLSAVGTLNSKLHQFDFVRALKSNQLT